MATDRRHGVYQAATGCGGAYREWAWVEPDNARMDERDYRQAGLAPPWEELPEPRGHHRAILDEIAHLDGEISNLEGRLTAFEPQHQALRRPGPRLHDLGPDRFVPDIERNEAWIAGLSKAVASLCHQLADSIVEDQGPGVGNASGTGDAKG